MKNFQLVAQGIDVGQLILQVTRQPDLWKSDTYLRDYPQGPFGDTETIFLRFPPASVTELERAARDQHECVWMDGAIHLPAALPLIHGLAARVQAERIGRVMINKLRPGGRVFPHADTPAHAEYYDRFHVVLQSAPGCNFRCGDETIHMQTGCVYWFNNALEHEVVNNSVDDRIHMIVDLRCWKVGIRGATPSTIMLDKLET